MFEIEKNIPIPNPEVGRNRLYPFDDLEIGDSFFVPNKTRHDFSGPLHQASQRTKFKFSVRSVDGGVRIWRVK